MNNLAFLQAILGSVYNIHSVQFLEVYPIFLYPFPQGNLCCLIITTLEEVVDSLVPSGVSLKHWFDYTNTVKEFIPRGLQNLSLWDINSQYVSWF